jgi:hypothetical protein
MIIDISQQTETRLTGEARRQGISVDALLEQMIGERATGTSAGSTTPPELPVLHLGPMGALHRRDIHSDVR